MTVALHLTAQSNFLFCYQYGCDASTNKCSAGLYGSRLNSKDVFEAILGFKSKVESYDLCSRVSPSFLPEDYDVVEISGLESAVQKLLRNGRVVVKGEQVYIHPEGKNRLVIEMPR